MQTQTQLTESSSSSITSKSNFVPSPSTLRDETTLPPTSSSLAANQSANVSKTLMTDATVTSSNPDYLTSNDLTAGEQSLLDVWKKRQKLGFNPFNVRMTYGSAALMFLYVCASKEPMIMLADRVRSWTDLGISFTTTILGFLIAGFTIFATLNRPDMFVAMGKIEKPGKGMSLLKANFFSFMGVFIDYLTFFGVCLAIKLLATQHGPLSTLLEYLPKGVRMWGHWFSFKRMLTDIGIVGMSTGFVYTTLLLKSFVWNIYHVLMTGVRWHWENPSDGS